MFLPREAMRHLGSQLARVASLLLLASFIVLAGCSTNQVGSASSYDAQAMEQRMQEQDKKAIEEGLDRDLKPLVSPSAKELREYFANDAALLQDVQSELSTDPYEMLSHLLKDFSYEIVDVDVRGSEATAKVTISSVDATSAIEESAQALSQDDELESNAQLYNSEDEADHQAFIQHIYDTLYEKIDTSSQRKTSELELRLTKGDQGWLLSSNSLEELVAALY